MSAIPESTDFPPLKAVPDAIAPAEVELTAAGLSVIPLGVSKWNRPVFGIKGLPILFTRWETQWEVENVFLPLQAARTIYATPTGLRYVRVMGFPEASADPDTRPRLKCYAPQWVERREREAKMGREAYSQDVRRRNAEAEQALAEGRIDDLMIPLYEVDTPEGLRLLADAIKGYVLTAQAVA